MRSAVICGHQLARHMPRAPGVKTRAFGSRTTAEQVLAGQSLSGTYAVTGGNTGIGAETCKALARAGARVLLCARDLKSAAAVAEQVNGKCAGTVETRELDLADLASVSRCSEALAAEERLDGLVLNAGLMACPEMRTKDGFEQQIGVNHLGHFALAAPLLEKMAKQSFPSRVVVVSSSAHAFGSIDLVDLNWRSRKYSAWPAYGQSKLANVLFVKELQHRLAGSQVSAFALHPGLVLSNLGRYLVKPGSPLSFVLLAFASPFAKNIEQGAATSTYCLTTPGLEAQSGGYFADCKPASLRNNQATDRQLAQQLWALSEQLTGQTWAI